MPTIRSVLSALAVAFLFGIAPVMAMAEEESIDIGGQVIDFGVQPEGFPVVMFSEVIKRDRILRDQLAKVGWSVRQHPFFKGNDIIEYLEKDQLEAAMLGDMPTINALSRHDLLVVGLLKHTFSWVVTRHPMELIDLKGKKIGNGFGSSAHYTLLEGLSTVGLSEKDVQLVDTKVSDMPAALASGKIDAFSAWEPAPTIALASNPAYFVAYRGVSDDYLVISRKLAEQQPEVTRQFLAAFARALYWMRQSRDHMVQAAQWSLQAGQELSKKPPALSVEQSVVITQRDAINVPGMPMLPREGDIPIGRMAKKMEFLKQIGKAPPTASWEKVSGSFAPQWMEDVLRHPTQYRVYSYDYGQ